MTVGDGALRRRKNVVCVWLCLSEPLKLQRFIPLSSLLLVGLPILAVLAVEQHVWVPSPGFLLIVDARRQSDYLEAAHDLDANIVFFSNVEFPSSFIQAKLLFL